MTGWIVAIVLFLILGAVVWYVARNRDTITWVREKKRLEKAAAEAHDLYTEKMDEVEGLKADLDALTKSKPSVRAVRDILAKYQS